MEDKKYEATITKYHVRKSKFRVEYDDSEHEWIDLRAEQDRVQVKEVYEDGVVQWIDFKFLRDPAKDKGKGVRPALLMGGGREEDEVDRKKREKEEASSLLPSLPQPLPPPKRPRVSIDEDTASPPLPKHSKSQLEEVFDSIFLVKKTGGARCPSPCRKAPLPLPSS